MTHCSSCHGTYGEDASYPNLVVPLDDVGTDPEYALAATDGSEDRFYEWVKRSYLRRVGGASAREGLHRPAARRGLGDRALSAQRVGPGRALASRQPASSDSSGSIGTIRASTIPPSSAGDISAWSKASPR